MINLTKVTKEIHTDGKYDEILEVAKKTLNCDDPTLEDIEKLILEDEYYIKEYKDLNRWGELSSVHLKELEIDKDDASEVKKLKKEINAGIKFLRDREEYEVASKNIIYLAWTIFIALPSIYIIDSLVRLFTNLYITNENTVYFFFAIVVFLSIFGYLKVSSNHKRLHKQYIQTRNEMRELIKHGIEQDYFAFYEIYED